jgi:endoglucanase
MTAFSPDDAERIRDLGLDHVRLPVDEDVLWHADGRMDARGVAALRETVAWCLRADLRVIVDLHVVRSHRHLRSAPGLFEDPGDRALLAGLWADLADALADLPLDAVAYELLNEPTARDDEVWNEVAGLAIEAIRACEPSRMILLGSNRYNLFAALASLRVPDDPNLILGFHYYEPMAFTHYRAPWNRILAPYAGPITYPGRPVPEGELARLDPTLRRALEPLNRHLGRDQIRGDLSVPLAVARRTGLRLHCGELGVLNTVPDDLRLRWYRDVIDTLEESGIAWATWNLRGRFGLYDGDGPTVVHRAIAERRFARDGAAAAVPG